MNLQEDHFWYSSSDAARARALEARRASLKTFYTYANASRRAHVSLYVCVIRRLFVDCIAKDWRASPSVSLSLEGDRTVRYELAPCQ